MTAQDKQRWDERYRSASAAVDAGLADVFADHRDLLASPTSVLELACGGGRAACWFARRGATVLACDVSPVAIERARQLAALLGVAGQCSFVVADLDDGLPSGPPVELIFCSMFRDPALDQKLLDRLAPGGVLAIACLSEVGASPGRFRAAPSELLTAFASLETLVHEEGNGVALLIAKKPAERVAVTTDRVASGVR